MAQQKICILGGSGFVGSHIASKLAARGDIITIPTRRRERSRDLLVLPTARVVEMNVHDEEQLIDLFVDHDVVINLVGILNERGHSGKGFRRAHVELTQKVISACRTAGVARLLHMSALGADKSGPSHYQRTKGEAQELVLAADDLNVTVFRPSVIFGPGDSFLNRFAGLLKMIPAPFPLAGADSRFAPIFVSDVAGAYVNAIDNPETYGKAYDLCGPREYTLKELVEFTAQQLGLTRWVIPLPKPIGWLQAATMEWLPGKPLSLDNFNSLKVPNICNGPIAPELNIIPTPLEAVAPDYLGGDNRRSQINDLRGQRH